MTTAERFLDKVVVDLFGHWLWTGAGTQLGKKTKFWYGKFDLHQAHRRAWEIFRGPIPPGLQIDHLCRVTYCVNPAHLEPVTPVENIRRSTRYNPDGSTCCRGHLMVPGTYKVRKEGFKRCLLCMKEDNAKKK